jgi:hypothetical protein
MAGFEQNFNLQILFREQVNKCNYFLLNIVM